jgi:hypothetical protein
MHKSKKFISWMKNEYSYICVLFVLANSTSRLELVDVILQKTFKCVAL